MFEMATKGPCAASPPRQRPRVALLVQEPQSQIEQHAVKCQMLSPPHSWEAPAVGPGDAAARKDRGRQDLSPAAQQCSGVCATLLGFWDHQTLLCSESSFEWGWRARPDKCPQGGLVASPLASLMPHSLMNEVIYQRHSKAGSRQREAEHTSARCVPVCAQRWQCLLCHTINAANSCLPTSNQPPHLLLCSHHPPPLAHGSPCPGHGAGRAQPVFWC